MTWSEYKAEVSLLETDVSGSDGEGGAPDDFTREDWEDLNSEHLLNMWLSIQSYLETYYLKSDYLQSAKFGDFCDFVYKFSG